MDFLTLEPSKENYQHILVITDHFTRFAMAIPIRNQLARTVADAFYNNFILHYGIPERIHSDKGANIESTIIKELCTIMGMFKSRTTSYHPMENGQCERFNRTLCDMLGSLDPSKKANWKSYVSPLVFAYNSTRHESTGQSPFMLMFGRNPRLPIDAALGLRKNQQDITTTFMTELKDRIPKAHEVATDATNKAARKQKDNYDNKVRGGTVQVGDRVLVKVISFVG
jgi:transposase InsO family protein